DAELVSTLAARLTRLNRQLDGAQAEAIQKAAGGSTVPQLAASLLKSIDPDEVARHAAQKFSLPTGQEPSEEQLQKAEVERMRAALKPFHDPGVRKVILAAAEAALEQVVAEGEKDHVLRAGFDADALERAQGLVRSFRQFLEDHRQEIEALQVLYS